MGCRKELMTVNLFMFDTMSHGHPFYLPDMFVSSLSGSVEISEYADCDVDQPLGNCVYFYRVAGFKEFAKGKTPVQKRIDDQSSATGTSYMYVGISDPGIPTGSWAWAIKRVTFIDGDPVAEEWTECTASWANRLTAVYR
jgi:hypothetical protein